MIFICRNLGYFAIYLQGHPTTIGTSSMNTTTNGTSSGTGGNSNSQSGMTINPVSMTLSPGATIDWNGRNFGREEPIRVNLNGQTVATAHADGGGNFSTGSIKVPMTPGTYTYIFAGDKGSSAMSTIMVQ